MRLPLRLLVLLIPLTAFGEWETVTHDGHPYVTARSLKEFYRFDTLTEKDGILVLENQHVTCRFTIEGREVFLNEVKFLFSFPVIPYGERFLISQVDLGKTIDPVLRPSYLQPKLPFDTILLDPEPLVQAWEAEAPVEEAPVEEAPVEEAPVEEAPGAEEESKEIETPDPETAGEEEPAPETIAKAIPIEGPADSTLAIARLTAESLRGKNFTTTLTRDVGNPNALPFAERLKAVNAVEHDLAIVLRVTDDPATPEGIRTWVMAPEGDPAELGESTEAHHEAQPGNTNDALNIAAAVAIHSSIVLSTRRPDRGIARSRDPLLTGATNPILIIEVGNLAHPAEAKLLEYDSFQGTVGTAIANGARKLELASRRPAPPKKEPATE